MTARARYAACCLAGLLLSLGGAVAHAQVAVPPFTARVVDRTLTLSAEEVAALESKLADFEQRKGSQIAVLIVPTTEPEAIEDYGIRVAEAWKAGRKDADDGAILLVAKDDRALRIEVGYGLEGALPDAVANRIVEDIIVPRFRGGDFAGGIEEGVDRMIGVIDGEPLPPPKWRERGQEGQRAQGGRRGEPGFGSALPIVFILAFTLGATLKRIFGRFGGGLITGGIAGVVAWFIVSSLTIAAFAAIAAFVLSMFAGSSRGLWTSGGRGRGHGRRGGWGGGGFGGGGFGGGGFGGGGGGGFGGGGGGGFGGGGASGRW